MQHSEWKRDVKARHTPKHRTADINSFQWYIQQHTRLIQHYAPCLKCMLTPTLQAAGIWIYCDETIETWCISWILFRFVLHSFLSHFQAKNNLWHAFLWIISHWLLLGASILSIDTFYVRFYFYSFAKRIHCFTTSNLLTHVFDFWCVSVFLLIRLFLVRFAFLNIIIVQFILVLCTLHTGLLLVFSNLLFFFLFSSRIWSGHLIYNGKRMKRLLLCRFPKWIDKIWMEIENPIYKRDFHCTIFIRSMRYACYFAIFIAFESDSLINQMK